MTAGGLDLFSWPARAVWVVLYSWVLASHLVHVSYMRGQPRYWHLTHVSMALGMIYMFTPWKPAPTSDLNLERAFLVIAALVGLFVLVEWARNRAVNLLWFTQLLAMLAMAFMYSLMVNPPRGYHTLTYAFVVWFVFEASGWSRRHFAELDEERTSWVPFSLHPRPANAVCASRLCGRVPVDLSLSGTIMALGMAWMFLAMDSPAATYIGRATTAGHSAQSGWVAAGAFAALLLVVPIPFRAARA
jgi:hypothetical protein